MKRINLLLFIFFCFSLTNIYSDEFTITRKIPEGFTGTYEPECFKQELETSLSFNKAKKKCEKNNVHEILLLSNERCESFSTDGYAIPNSEIEKWQFLSKNGEKIIKDQNGNIYNKISDRSDYKGIDVLNQKSLETIFRYAVTRNDISVTNMNVNIGGSEYYFNADVVWFSDVNYSAWLRSNKEDYALKIEGITAKLYKMKRVGHIGYEATDELCLEIPLFNYNDIDYPNFNLENLTKQEYRILRNLIYAKHGYDFKSTDLRNLFSKYSWYKVNPNFSENDFSAEEKDCIKRIQEKENK